MSVWYGATFATAFILAVVCLIKYKNNNLHMIGLFMSVLVTNAGYFMLSISKSVGMALVFNSISYLGSVFLPMFMSIIILDMCKIKISKITYIVLTVISLIVFAVASSAWCSDIYYKEVSLTTVNNATVLNKVYGPLHPTYKIFILAYLLGMVGMIVYSFVKKTGKNLKISVFQTVIVSINIGVWLTEAMIDNNFEYMAVAYVITEILLLLFYEIVNELQKYDMIADELLIAQTDISDVSGANDNGYNPDYFSKEDAERIAEEFKDVGQITNREKDVMVLLLEGKRRKEIAEILYVTESTIKKHSSSIYKKFEVENRKDLINKVKISM